MACGCSTTSSALPGSRDEAKRHWKTMPGLVRTDVILSDPWVRRPNGRGRSTGSATKRDESKNWKPSKDRLVNEPMAGTSMRRPIASLSSIDGGSAPAWTSSSGMLAREPRGRLSKITGRPKCMRDRTIDRPGQSASCRLGPLGQLGNQPRRSSTARLRILDHAGREDDALARHASRAACSSKPERRTSTANSGPSNQLDERRCM